MSISRQLKHWFVPHKGNRHHPHILRPRGLSLVAVLVLGLQLGFNLSVSGHAEVLGYATDISAPSIISLTNQQRAAAGLGALRENSRLDQAAYNNAQYMFAHDYWAHVAPDGTTPWYFVTQAGYAYATAGQNLAKDFSTSSAVVNAWMNSPEHRANILNGGYVDTGVAVVNGILQGEQTTLVVAFYASPVQTAAPAAASRPASPAQAAPAATPVPAPAPTPATPVSSPSPSPAARPTVQGLSTQPVNSGPVPAATPIGWTLAAARGLGWGRGATLVLLLILLALYAWHFLVLRRIHPRHTRYLPVYHRYPFAQMSAVLTIIVLVAAGAQGVIR